MKSVKFNENKFWKVVKKERGRVDVNVRIKREDKCM